jgi:hypothetical protein
VKLAEHILTGHKVAIKILNRKKIKAMDMEEKVRHRVLYGAVWRRPGEAGQEAAAAAAAAVLAPPAPTLLLFSFFLFLTQQPYNFILFFFLFFSFMNAIE